jgi:predicted AlkP superfamily phosphohydrolase/phosphomutase
MIHVLRVRPIRSIVTLLLVVLCASWAGSSRSESGDEPAPGASLSGGDGRVIVLGWDGADGPTVERMMDAGQLPNLLRLREMGTFAHLGTTNPAESPVSWAALNTGTNPGRTGVPGFVKRDLRDGHPIPAFGHLTQEDRRVDSFELDGLLGLLVGTPSRTLIVGTGLGTLVVFFLLFAFALGLNRVLAGVLSIALGCAGAWGASSARNLIPTIVPDVFGNPIQEEGFWATAAREGVRSVVLDAAMAFDRPHVENARVLAGLGVPDSRGGIGDWFVYTTSEYRFQRPPEGESTSSGGTVFKVFERNGIIESQIFGPKNFYVVERLGAQLDALEMKLKDPEMGFQEASTLREKQKQLKAERKKASAERITQPLVVKKKGDGTADVTLGTQTQNLGEGDWSDWYRLSFEINPLIRVRSITRVKIVKMDEPHFELFVNTLDIDPENPVFWQAISQPMDFSADLVRISGGLYETIGWGCVTMPFKDKEIDVDTFLEDVEFTLGWRERVTYAALERDDFEVFFSVFSTTDRVQHMMYQFYDRNHPLYDAEKAHREVRFFGETIALQDVIPAIYRQVDRVTGNIMDRYMREGDTLLVCSDHGFQSFHRGININNWLAENGFLAIKADMSSRQNSTLRFVDWSKTRAYSLGLGMVYLNLKGREAGGIVDPADRDAVIAEIREAFLATVDPETGKKIGRDTFDLRKIHEGPYVDREADMMLGFAATFRVSWRTTLGGIKLAKGEDGVYGLGAWIQDNTNNWSGDHVSVAPDLVKGMFFSNRPLHVPAGGVDLLHIAPTVLSLVGVDAPSHYDSSALEFE